MIATKFFCRATLRASVVLAVGPVFLSHSFIKAPKDITKLFSRLGSPVIAVFFDSIRHYTIPRVTRNWETEINVGSEEFVVSANISLYLGSGTRQTKGCYGTLIGSHRYPIDPCSSKAGCDHPIFSGGYPYVRSYRLTNSDKIRHHNPCGEGCVSKGSDTPTSQEAKLAAHPKFAGTPY